MSPENLNCSGRGSTVACFLKTAAISFLPLLSVLHRGWEAPVRGMLWSALPSSQFCRAADSYQRAKSIKDITTQAYHWERGTNLLHQVFTHTPRFILLHSGPSQPVSISLENLTCFFIPRKPWGGQSRENWGLTPDALLLAPRATERFLRPVKPAGCAQGSKIQQIPGQLSGDSYFVNGHTELKTFQIFENSNYRLNKSIKDGACCTDEYLTEQKPLSTVVFHLMIVFQGLIHNFCFFSHHSNSFIRAQCFSVFKL